jgi:flagellar biosynthesis GTPase FlhF
MNSDTRHKAIIALSFLIAVGAYLDSGQSAQAGFVAGLSAFPLLYAAYYALHVVRWVAFRGENGTGLEILPRIGRSIAWVFRSIFGTIRAVLLALVRGALFSVRTTTNALARRKWERERLERERLAAEEAKALAERQHQEAEDTRRKNEIAEQEAHQRRVAREAEVAEARIKAEATARLQMQEEANRLAREHEEQMLAIERERLAIAEKRGKRHEAIMGTIADLVAKSKE